MIAEYIIYMFEPITYQYVVLSFTDSPPTDWL